MSNTAINFITLVTGLLCMIYAFGPAIGVGVTMLVWFHKDQEH